VGEKNRKEGGERKIGRRERRGRGRGKRRYHQERCSLYSCKSETHGRELLQLLC
jgi:hypothetical protein